MLDLALVALAALFVSSFPGGRSPRPKVRGRGVVGDIKAADELEELEFAGAGGKREGDVVVPDSAHGTGFTAVVTSHGQVLVFVHARGDQGEINLVRRLGDGDATQWSDVRTITSISPYVSLPPALSTHVEESGAAPLAMTYQLASCRRDSCVHLVLRANSSFIVHTKSTDPEHEIWSLPSSRRPSLAGAATENVHTLRQQLRSVSAATGLESVGVSVTHRGRGIVALRSFNEGESIFTIQLSHCIDVGPAVIEGGMGRLPITTQGYADVIAALRTSKYAPYKAVLPKVEEDCVLLECWTKEERDALQDSEVSSVGLTRKKKLAAVFKEVKQGGTDPVATSKELLASHFYVQTRSFFVQMGTPEDDEDDVPTHAYLMPVVDMLNTDLVCLPTLSSWCILCAR